LLRRTSSQRRTGTVINIKYFFHTFRRVSP
jgi:hypothetical protein